MYLLWCLFVAGFGNNFLLCVWHNCLAVCNDWEGFIRMGGLFFSSLPFLWACFFGCSCIHSFFLNERLFFIFKKGPYLSFCSDIKWLYNAVEVANSKFHHVLRASSHFHFKFMRNCSANRCYISLLKSYSHLLFIYLLFSFIW